jgi:hypothetical protein
MTTRSEPATSSGAAGGGLSDETPSMEITVGRALVRGVRRQSFGGSSLMATYKIGAVAICVAGSGLCACSAAHPGTEEVGGASADVSESDKTPASAEKPVAAPSAPDAPAAVASPSADATPEAAPPTRRVALHTGPHAKQVRQARRAAFRAGQCCPTGSQCGTLIPCATLIPASPSGGGAPAAGGGAGCGFVACGSSVCGGAGCGCGCGCGGCGCGGCGCV